MRNLTEQQQKAVEKFSRLRVGALFMACGTGKTQTAAAIINGINDAQAVFWLTPCQTKDNLKNELSECDMRTQPEIYGIESLNSDRIYLELRDKVKNSNNAVLVCDESLKIKNITAKRTKKLLELSKFASYRLILNGTPITRNILDIFCQMEFLSPKILGISYRQFKSRYCVLAQKKIGSRVISEWVKSEANVDHLMSIIEPYIFQCDLEMEVEKQHKTIYYDIDECRDKYEELKQEMLEEMRAADYNGVATSILGYLQRMQQSYCDAKDKVSRIRDIVDDKTIIFCKFIRSQELLQKEFPDTMILTYGKNSLGLNLQQMNKCIFFDKTFDYAFAEQSEYRIFRKGQKEDCIYYHLTGNAKLEGMIDRCIDKKITLVQYFKEVGNKIGELL